MLDIQSIYYAPMISVICYDVIYVYKQNKRKVIVLKIADQYYKHILYLIIQWLFY